MEKYLHSPLLAFLQWPTWICAWTLSGEWAQRCCQFRHRIPALPLLLPYLPLAHPWSQFKFRSCPFLLTLTALVRALEVFGTSVATSQLHWQPWPVCQSSDCYESSPGFALIKCEFHQCKTQIGLGHKSYKIILALAEIELLKATFLQMEALFPMIVLSATLASEI